MTLIPAWINDTLVPVEKLRVHKMGLKHKAVSVFVMDGDNVLIQRRALSKYHTPGLWANTCCTHPQWGEDILECAKRRLKEELGIDGVEPVFCDRLEYRADVGKGMIEHEIVDLFTASACSKTLVQKLNPDEVAETKWVDIHKLVAMVVKEPTKYSPWLKIYLEDHLNLVIKN